MESESGFVQSFHSQENRLAGLPDNKNRIQSCGPNGNEGALSTGGFNRYNI